MSRMDRVTLSRSALAALVCLAVIAVPATAQHASPQENGDKLVQIDFDDVELSAVIETIAKLTNKNFIYDDRVRGRVAAPGAAELGAVLQRVAAVEGDRRRALGRRRMRRQRQAPRLAVEVLEPLRQIPERVRLVEPDAVEERHARLPLGRRVGQLAERRYVPVDERGALDEHALLRGDRYPPALHDGSASPFGRDRPGGALGVRIRHLLGGSQRRPGLHQLHAG